MKHKFKIGDIVKQISNVTVDENPIATITKIVGNVIYHKHKGSNRVTLAGYLNFVLIKVTDWRERIEGGNKK